MRLANVGSLELAKLEVGVTARGRAATASVAPFDFLVAFAFAFDTFPVLGDESALSCIQPSQIGWSATSSRG